MTHVVRLAVARHLAGLADDQLFQAKLQARLEEEQQTLQRFARVPASEAAGARALV